MKSFNPDDLPSTLYEYRSPRGEFVALNKRTPDSVYKILTDADNGLMSVRMAADKLDWTLDDVQMVMWGEVRI